MPFEILNQNEYLLINFSEEVFGDHTKSLVEDFKKIQEESGLKLCVINFNDCHIVDVPLLRHLAMIYRELKLKNGKLRTVGANEKILDLIKKNGLDQVLINKLSLRGALVDLGLVKAKEIDTNFINPFLNATMKVFKIQCFMELKPQAPTLKKPTDPLLMGDVSGIISITSETFNGTLAISMSEAIFCEVSKKMLGEEVSSITPENVDLIGELANIILGQAKVELGQLGYRVEMALPSCIWGKDHKIKHFGAGVCILLPFECEFGVIYSEIMTNNSVMMELSKAKPKKAA